MRPGYSPIWKEADEGWIGYVEQTGHTFLVDAFSRLVFDIISDQAHGSSRELLVSQLHTHVPELNEADVEARLEVALDTLTAAHLIDAADIETW